MKKITKFLAFIGVAGLVFTSCDKPSDEVVYPSFTQVTMEETAEGTFFGRFDVTCDPSASLKEVKASYTYGDTTLEIPEKDLDITKGKNYDWTVKITVPVEVSGTRVTKMTLTATVRGSNGGTKSVAFDTPKKNEPAPDPDTALSAAAAFTFKRVGGNPATGDISKFGLKWTENVLASTDVSIQKDGAAKFVELAASDWTSITTKESLKAAVDKATDMNSYRGINADKGQDYDVTLGVLNADVYYILHITRSTVTSNATTGTTIEIFGEYRF